MKRLSLLLLWLSAVPILADGLRFSRAFAPQEGLVNRYEEACRQEICLNGRWQFQATTNLSIPGDVPAADDRWDRTPIKIPSPWNVNGFSMEDNMPGGDFRAYPSYPKEWEKVQAAWMQKTVSVPKEWSDKRIMLHFGAVAGKMVVYVNGRRAGEGFDIFFPQEFDVTDLLKSGGENQILVKVIRPKVFDVPGKYGRREYLAGSFWGSYIAGIWQDVFLEARPDVSISDVFVQPQVDRDELIVEVSLTNQSGHPITAGIAGEVHEWINQAGTSVLDAPEVRWNLASQDRLPVRGDDAVLEPGQSKKIILTAKVAGRLKSWSPDNPNLYGLLLTLSSGGRKIDVKYQRFGWRQFSVKDGKLQLNGEPIVLRGDSWHFMGTPQMSRRYAYAWFKLLKDAGANAVRLHASVYPSFYHDMADEMGIAILDESAIWLSDGGPKADSDLFWTNCRTHVEELVRRDRNHPSVFGWSVCNESLAVLRNVWHAPKEMVDRGLDEISAWTAICHTNDPTRPWISGDGEGDAEGRLPVFSIHYGGDEESRRAARSGKPWGVGETSMAYYGTPKQVAKFNGDRAYESAEGRMEGLAYECYGLLHSQQKFGADYQSVFNIVWYSIQPLPFGKRDEAAPTLADGIFFPDCREGLPGMQPERLGPYVSTLNPGYDPALPLYRPWPMFEAIRDANLGMTNSPWARSPMVKAAKVFPGPQTTNAVVSYAAKNGSRLAENFRQAGITASVWSPETKTDILLVDGSATNLGPTTQQAISQVAGQGGTVWVWNIEPAGARELSQMFKKEIQVVTRSASSFVVKETDPLLAGLDNASFYFSEGDGWRQMTYGLSGAFVNGAKVLLEACPADWRQWNYKGEPVKTAALLRSETENTASRITLLVRPHQNGRVILCTLSSKIDSARKREVIATLFRNLGVPINSAMTNGAFLDENNRLARALVCGAIGFADAVQAYSNALPHDIRDGGSIDGRKWSAHNAGQDAVFDFKDGTIDGPQDNAVAYLAVWIKSPKPLNDLLFEPNMPKVSFTYGSDDGCQVWLNGELLATHERVGPLDPDAFLQDPLLLKLGWNQLVVKVVQLGGEWKFAGRFGCSDPAFLQKLEFVTEKPASE